MSAINVDSAILWKLCTCFKMMFSDRKFEMIHIIKEYELFLLLGEVPILFTYLYFLIFKKDEPILSKNILNICLRNLGKIKLMVVLWKVEPGRSRPWKRKKGWVWFPC